MPWFLDKQVDEIKAQFADSKAHLIQVSGRNPALLDPRLATNAGGAQAGGAPRLPRPGNDFVDLTGTEDSEWKAPESSKGPSAGNRHVTFAGDKKRLVDDAAAQNPAKRLKPGAGRDGPATSKGVTNAAAGAAAPHAAGSKLARTAKPPVSTAPVKAVTGIASLLQKATAVQQPKAASNFEHDDEDDDDRFDDDIAEPLTTTVQPAAQPRPTEAETEPAVRVCVIIHGPSDTPSACDLCNRCWRRHALMHLSHN